MYTILVNQDNTLTTSIKERIMQRSKLVDSLHFLVDPIYKDNIDMSSFTVNLEYILPVSKQYRTEILYKSDELYKEKLEYKLPFDTALTKEPGDISVQLTFTMVDLDEDGKNKQYVRKTSETTVHITPISAWSDIIPDDALNAIDMAMLQLEGKIKQVDEIANTYNSTKADNIRLDEKTKELYLTANGDAVGDKILIEQLGDSIAENTKDGVIQVII